MSPRANKTQRNNDKRPPLGPNARKNLGVFGLITGIHTLATVIFSAALASLIARQPTPDLLRSPPSTSI